MKITFLYLVCSALGGWSHGDLQHNVKISKDSGLNLRLLIL